MITYLCRKWQFFNEYSKDKTLSKFLKTETDKKHLSLAKKLFKTTSNVICLAKNGIDIKFYIYTIFHLAAKKNDEHTIRFLIKEFYSIFPGILFALVAKYGYLSKVKFMFKIVNGINADNSNIILETIEHDIFYDMKILLIDCDNIHVTVDYAFILAARNGHLSIVKYLFKHGVDIHARRDAAFILSASNGYLSIVKFLVKKNVDIQSDYNYALRWASHNGHFKIVKILIANGANIHEQDDYALLASAHNGHLNIVKFLIENGANIHANDNMLFKLPKIVSI